NVNSGEQEKSKNKQPTEIKQLSYSTARHTSPKLPGKRRETAKNLVRTVKNMTKPRRMPVYPGHGSSPLLQAVLPGYAKRAIETGEEHVRPL
ncbi:hypothetical protein, partial [Shinella sp.]|uniref:hypothetical protein n=1 Tax=Shinella sp. TaxID=1870904 RepID=UPI0040356C7D